MASYQKRGENSYLLVVEAGYDAKGKRIKRTRTLRITEKFTPKKLKEHLELELAKFKMAIEAGEYIAPEKMTFSSFVEEWREKYAPSELGAKTLENYLYQINNRLIPEFGHLRIDQIKPLHIVTFLKELQDEGNRQDGNEGKLSSSMIQYIHRVLKNIFERAVDWKLINTSPLEGVKKPKAEQAETEVYDETEAYMLLQAIESEPLMWRVMVKLALTTGLRRGELLGLEWKHIEVGDGVGTIDVRQSLTYVKDIGYLIKEPKTKKSIRKVSIPSTLLPELKTLKKQSTKARIQEEELWKEGKHFFVFSASKGKPLYPTRINTWWPDFIKRHNLKYIRFHDLRHTSATLLINKGVHAKIISERLGHANISTTMNIYGHTLRSAEQEAAKHFNSLFASNHPKNKNG